MRDLARVLGETQTADQLGPLLLNPEGPQLRERLERYKLYPSAYDRKLYGDLIDLDYQALRKKHSAAFHRNGRVLESAERTISAWGFLREEAEIFINADAANARGERLNALLAALLEDFQVIVITLDERDDAQVIFETLNAGGEPLAAMDLVRNDVFHRAMRAGEDVEALMESRWRVFEEPFWKEEGRRGRIKKPRIDFFLSDTLAAETGKEILLTELYAHYKSFVAARKFESADAELETLLRNAPTFRLLVDPVGDSSLAKLARHLSVFDVTTAYPLVFVIGGSDAQDEDKTALYRLILSYIVRRTLCGLTAKNYNNVFLPDDWAEHWPLPDGSKAAADLVTGMSESQLRLIADRQALKHTLGNLTLLTDARNPSLGNLGFAAKQDKLRESLLKLNHEIAEHPEWTETDIRARATRLSDLAIKIWPGLSPLL